MKPIDLIGFKFIVSDLVNNEQRQIAYQLLDYAFKNARELYQYDAIGELALKTEYRDLYFECAKRAYAVALTTQEKHAARNNLINAYNAMNYPEKALELIALQLIVSPDDFSTLCMKAANTSLMGNKEESEKMVLDLMEKFPEKDKDLDTMLCGKYLRKGHLVRGVSTFLDSDKPASRLFEKELKMKRWDGIARPGKIVYVNGEGGIGDEIINIRFFKNIKRLGMRPVLYSPNTEYYKDKNDLFKRHGIEVLSEPYSVDKSQYWYRLMCLPVALGLSESDLWEESYLTPLRSEKNKIVSDKFKIGIKCSGNPYFAQDEYRKIPLETMLQYLPENAEIYYIDKQAANHTGVIDLSGRINSWEDTLDFIDQMDCIVSSCTSLVHAAGAIGKTTFVAVPIAEYYIWTTSYTGTRSPWYGDNFHVMRQTQLRDWTHPLQEIQQKVNQLINTK